MCAARFCKRIRRDLHARTYGSLGIRPGWRRLSCLPWNRSRIFQQGQAFVPQFFCARDCRGPSIRLSVPRELNAKVKLILTVSPVPLVATATHEHVLLASTFSKSVLRTACGIFQQEFPE